MGPLAPCLPFEPHGTHSTHNLACRLPYSAVNFATFDLLDRRLASSFESAPARRFVAGAVAGVAGCVAAYPLDLLRTRLAAQVRLLGVFCVWRGWRHVRGDVRVPSSVWER